MHATGNGYHDSAFEAAFIDETATEPRRGKGEKKHDRDQVRRLDAWEQYRALWDGIDFKRQLVNMGDKKVRFALVIMGALNAVLLIVLTRGPVIRVIPDAVRVWLALLLVVYGVVTFMFMVHAIEALRPAPEARHQDAREWESREFGSSETRTRPVGLIIRGPLQSITFEEERHIWSHARLCDVNAELILFNRASSFILGRQHEQLRKVYQGLKVLVLLAAIVLALVVATSVWRGGAQGSTASIAEELGTLPSGTL